MRYTENFVDSLFQRWPVHLSAWVDRWSTVEPDVKSDMIETGHGPGRITVDEDSIWVTNEASETLTRIDRSGAVVDYRAPLRHDPAAIATGTEAVWVLAENGWLWRFHPDGTSDGVARTGRGARDLVCDEHLAWVLQGDGELVAVDQSTGETAVEARIPRGARQILVAGDHLVALTGRGRRVCRIAKEVGAVEAAARLPARGARAAFFGDAVWVACGRFRSTQWGALMRVDMATMSVDAIHELPNAPRAIAAGAGHIWVACGQRGETPSTVVRVDPRSGEMTRWGKTDWTINDLALAGDELVAACAIKLSSSGGGGSGG